MIKEVYAACCQSGHELLLEVILPADMPSSDDLYLRAVQRFYNLGVKPDWWKLPPQSVEGWNNISAVITERDTYCRGVVILGLDAPEAELKAGFTAAANQPLVKGFAVGRTIFGQPSRDWLAGNIDDRALIEKIKANYHNLITLWRQRG